jgi:hypothetical protein
LLAYEEKAFRLSVLEVAFSAKKYGKMPSLF